MRILMIGDVVGRPGRRACRVELETILHNQAIELVVCNGENAAGGKGITGAIAHELFGYGVDVLTMGNHVWHKKELMEIIDEEKRILRPANYPPGTPGVGYTCYRTYSDYTVGVINISGRVYLADLDCPFRAADQAVAELERKTSIILVDFHAEATSEKVAMGWYLNGRVTAVLGTHTHVQTADERILPKGTAYITDVGMTGPRDSVIGVKTETIIEKFVKQMPRYFEVAAGAYQFNAVLMDVNTQTGKALNIERISIFEEGC